MATKPQMRMLNFLSIRDRAGPENPTIARRIGMLRIMQERGLVSRNLHGEWSIKRKGRDLLEAQDQ